MSIVAYALGISVLVGLFLWQLQRRHVRALPEINDEQFGEHFRSRFGVSATIAVTERREIARLIGVNPDKLTPDIIFARLIAGPIDVGTRVGLGHLEDDLMDLAQRAKAKAVSLPPTLSELLLLRLDLKRRLEPGS